MLQIQKRKQNNRDGNLVLVPAPQGGRAGEAASEKGSEGMAVMIHLPLAHQSVRVSAGRL